MVSLLRVGLYNGSYLLLDLSLVRYAIAHFEETEIYAIVSLILSFFPFEGRFLKTVLSHLICQSNIHQTYRFIIYQIRKIAVLRQSAASHEVNAKISSSKEIDTACFQKNDSYWATIQEDISIFWEIYKAPSRTNALWVETITENRNYARFYEECSFFLMDSVSDFQGSIFQYYKKQ
jgi:hypothetical protein